MKNRELAIKFCPDLRRAAAPPLQSAISYLGDPRTATGADGPTTQFAAKQVDDPLESLLNGYTLTDLQKMASREARAVCRALTFRLTVKAGILEPTNVGGSGPMQPFEDMPEGLQVTYWHILGTILFEGRGIAGTDMYHRLPAGRSLLAVQCALDAYGTPA